MHRPLQVRATGGHVAALPCRALVLVRSASESAAASHYDQPLCLGNASTVLGRGCHLGDCSGAGASGALV